MPPVICPTCSQPVDLAATPAPPFCSERCRRIDLGRWLDERYTFPATSEEEEEEEEPKAEADEA